MKYNHNFHMVNFSPWPLISSISLLLLMISNTMMFYNKFNIFIVLFTMSMILIMYQWWRDIIRESTYQGLHSFNIVHLLKMGMVLFITSEIFFFISFFWSFFHFSLSQILDLGMMWPPMGIINFNPFLIPLLNTIILISSGISVTWAHHSLINNLYTEYYKSMVITLFLGLYFSLLQGYEYLEAPFDFADCSFGSVFYLATGFHGIHVLIGTFFLFICLLRKLYIHFSMFHHFGFEAAAWYWHFVDIVWLFLFVTVYWWN
uniref:Cytochrome c oxidase subunit 3 n=1 Tax=Cecidomyiidae sp. 3 LC-2017 TaxID=2030135 RepID=A0A343LA46_9DIPT|nr:cytochrome c oxidase subunit 3 [Cecidomyiidae sp. 3 LC-2017]